MKKKKEEKIKPEYDRNIPYTTRQRLLKDKEKTGGEL